MLIAALTAGSAFAQPAKFFDPAPPPILDASGPPAPVAEKENAIVHAAPKQLAQDAVNCDFPCLLGPTHNSVSPETHLLKTFPPGGPTLLWEFKKGEGYSQPAVANGRVVLFHRPEVNEQIDCLDADGETDLVQRISLPLRGPLRILQRPASRAGHRGRFSFHDRGGRDSHLHQPRQRQDPLARATSSMSSI